jgi:predicted DsbA family dithiol-disulfide isomerase
MQIDVYSDIVCPWCFIGKRRLERALVQTNRAKDVSVRWRPFELNPTMTKTGMGRRAYLEAKFGGPGEVKTMQDRVAAVGTSVGIEFAFDRVAKTPNTFDAHRLVWFAQQRGRQDEVVEELFHGYFMEGLDIGDRETLTSLAVRAGIDGEKVGQMLSTEEGAEAVRQEEVHGHQLGITSVPYFVLNGQKGISGAQPVETFVIAIQRGAQ